MYLSDEEKRDILEALYTARGKEEEDLEGFLVYRPQLTTSTQSVIVQYNKLIERIEDDLIT